MFARPVLVTALLQIVTNYSYIAIYNVVQLYKISNAAIICSYKHLSCTD